MKHIKRFNEINEELSPKIYQNAGRLLKNTGKNKRGEKLIDYGLRKEFFMYDIFYITNNGNNYSKSEFYDPIITFEYNKSSENSNDLVKKWTKGQCDLSFYLNVNFKLYDTGKASNGKLLPILPIKVTLAYNNSGLDSDDDQWFMDNCVGVHSYDYFEEQGREDDWYEDYNLYVNLYKDGKFYTLYRTWDTTGTIYYLLEPKEVFNTKELSKYKKANGTYKMGHGNDPSKYVHSLTFENGLIPKPDLYGYYDFSKYLKIELDYREKVDKGIFATRKSALHFKKIFGSLITSDIKDKIIDLLEIVGAETEDYEELASALGIDSNNKFRINYLYDDELAAPSDFKNSNRYKTNFSII